MTTHFPERNLKQKAVYWGDPQNDGFGKFTFGAEPIEIDCRYEMETKVVKNSSGVDVTSSVTVHVNQDLEEEGMLYLGLLDDLTDDQLANPYESDALQIISFAKSPTMKGTRFLRVAYL